MRHPSIPRDRQIGSAGKSDPFFFSIHGFLTCELAPESVPRYRFRSPFKSKLDFRGHYYQWAIPTVVRTKKRESDS